MTNNTYKWDKHCDFIFTNTPNLGLFVNHVFNANVKTLSQFETQLEKLAFPKNPNDLFGKDPYHDVLGQGWETLCHCIRTINGMDPKVKSPEPKLCPPGTIGVDAYDSWEDKPKTYQDKYKGRSKAWKIELAEGEDMKLERYRLQSIDEWKVDYLDTESMTVFTNTKGLHYWTADNLLAGKVKCVGRKEIQKFIDNKEWWKKARTLIRDHNPHVNF